MRGERGLDLAELDAVAADLDLVVDAAEELELAVGPPAGEVAGAVEPRARLAAERVGDEALGGQVGPVEVAARHAGAADVELAGDADRHRLEVPRRARRAACWRSAGRSGSAPVSARPRGTR